MLSANVANSRVVAVFITFPKIFYSKLLGLCPFNALNYEISLCFKGKLNVNVLRFQTYFKTYTKMAWNKLHVLYHLVKYSLCVRRTILFPYKCILTPNMTTTMFAETSAEQQMTRLEL
jgi:hypothetical protein